MDVLRVIGVVFLVGAALVVIALVLLHRARKEIEEMKTDSEYL